MSGPLTEKASGFANRDSCYFFFFAAFLVVFFAAFLVVFLAVFFFATFLAILFSFQNHESIPMSLDTHCELTLRAIPCQLKDQ